MYEISRAESGQPEGVTLSLSAEQAAFLSQFLGSNASLCLMNKNSSLIAQSLSTELTEAGTELLSAHQTWKMGAEERARVDKIRAAVEAVSAANRKSAQRDADARSSGRRSLIPRSLGIGQDPRTIAPALPGTGLPRSLAPLVRRQVRLSDVIGTDGVAKLSADAKAAEDAAVAYRLRGNKTPAPISLIEGE